MPKTVLVPVPDEGFEVHEVSIPWWVLSRAGHEIIFATENGGTPPRADPYTIDGVAFGALGASDEVKRIYAELQQVPGYRFPISYGRIEPRDFDALLLPGGHAPGMRQYLGSHVLHEKVAAFWELERPVAAICHGVVVLARARSPKTGKSVLAERNTTCLPKWMERLSYVSTAWKLGKHFRTYPEYVEDEVRAALDEPSTQFFRGPLSLGRSTADSDRGGFVVEDGRYVSARWPGDAYVFGRRLLARLDTDLGLDNETPPPTAAVQRMTT